jgi:hypothetical protein
MMKKIVFLLSSLILAFSVFSCGDVDVPHHQEYDNKTILPNNYPVVFQSNFTYEGTSYNAICFKAIEDEFSYSLWAKAVNTGIADTYLNGNYMINYISGSGIKYTENILATGTIIKKDFGSNTKPSDCNRYILLKKGEYGPSGSQGIKKLGISARSMTNAMSDVKWMDRDLTVEEKNTF